MKLSVLLFLLITPFCVASQTLVINYDCDKSRANLEGMNVGEKIKNRMTNVYSNLLWHYKVVSNENQIFCSLDSLTQKCEFEDSSSYAYNRIQIRGENNNWLKYVMIDKPNDNDNIYRILESNEKGMWNIDYESTKNILGYRCYKATSGDMNKKWAWFTLDLPFTLSPTDQLGFRGVVLEYFDGSSYYIAKNVSLDSETEIFHDFDLSNYNVKEFKNIEEFVPVLTSSTEAMSSNMFRCRK